MKARNYIVATLAMAGVWSGMSAHQNLESSSAAYASKHTIGSRIVLRDDSPATATASVSQEPEKRVANINLRANRARLKRGAEETVYIFVGDVLGYHNGAIILCDSAIQHVNRGIVECFGNVLINKDSTYIYGDKAIYNDVTGTAQVFSPLVKMIDGSAVLYTYNFSFNTFDNIGEYYGGGTVSRDGTLLESERGYYFADTKDFICVGDAELRDSTYQIRSDSIGYNMDSDIATFYQKTYIWNKDGEILSAKAGQYFTADERYWFTSDAYIMTDTRELWADEIDYLAQTDDAVLRRDIQIVDDEQKIMGFGDYGQYWGTPGNALLTENPSLISFDPEQPDSLYMRADSIFMLVLDSLSPFHTIQRNGGGTSATGSADSPYGNLMGSDETPSAEIQSPADTMDEAGLLYEGHPETANTINLAKLIQNGVSPETIESLMQSGEFERLVSLSEHEVDSLSSALNIESIELQRIVGLLIEEAEAIATIGTEDTEEIAESVVETVDDAVSEIAEDIEEEYSNNIEPLAEQEQQSETQQQQPEPNQKKDKKSECKKRSDAKKSSSDQAAEDTAIVTTTDESVQEIAGIEDINTIGSPEDSEYPTDTADNDDDYLVSETMPGGDGEDLTDVGEDGTETVGEAEEEEVNIDEMEQKVVLAYHDVRVFRNDLQAVCDSLVGFSIDSTLHMYIKPIIWSDNNQITSDQVVFYTQNRQLYKAHFTGDRPMAGQRLDSKHFNQLTSREITMFFIDNELHRMDGYGNSETYYYGQDSEDKSLNSFMTIESSNLTFIIADGEISTITYRQNPVAWLYPMDRIPADQSQIMQGFVWHGDRKPEKKDVFARTVRPSQREEYLALPQPFFPLTEKIDGHRVTLIGSGKWRDRTDTLSEENRAYVEALRAAGGLN